MAYQTLYRKYRPKTFELVFGQDKIIKTLKNAIKNDKLSHSYLFTGPRGTGKTSSAKLFAKAINCLNPKNCDACNECENCKSFNNNNNPDIIEIDAASNNGVDEIREIKNKVNLVPAMSKYKVYIIDEVHMLSIGAFNALLKTLEEPPEYIIFILATTEPQKIPATIISRCQRFDFSNISKEKMKECLNNIIKNENIVIDNEALDEIINNSNGGMRDAIGMLEQCFAFADNKITLNDVEELYGNISNKEIIDFLTLLYNENYKEILTKINKWSSLGKDFYLITQKIIYFLRNGLIYKKIKNNVSKNEKEIYDKYTDTQIYFMIDSFIEIENKIKISYQKELIFEIYIISLIDKKSNVSRETLNKNVYQTKKENKKNSDKIIEKDKSKLNEKIAELKDIRINNILKKSTKTEILKIEKDWKKTKEYLLDLNFKKVAGVLMDGKPVAAANDGIIITFPTDSIVDKIEKEYETSKLLLKQIFDKNYKIVFISEKYWLKIRPKYIEKVKKNMLELLDEEYLISQINKLKKSEIVTEFGNLIEMEDIK